MLLRVWRHVDIPKITNVYVTFQFKLSDFKNAFHNHLSEKTQF